MGTVSKTPILELGPGYIAEVEHFLRQPLVKRRLIGLSYRGKGPDEFANRLKAVRFELEKLLLTNEAQYIHAETPSQTHSTDPNDEPLSPARSGGKVPSQNQPKK